MSVPFKYDVGYHEYGRIRKKFNKGKYNSFDLLDNGVCLVSPVGKEYRYYGKGGIGWRHYSWGYRFRKSNGEFRDLCVGTLMRLMMFGWKWVRDKDKKEKHYSIARWPDGNHFYVKSNRDEPISYLGFNKFNTYQMAEEAGENWVKMNKLAC